MMSQEKSDLRARALELLRSRSGPVDPNLTTIDPGELIRVVHELQVHQIELELQNEELRSTQAKLEKLRAGYFDLYDRAPVGYASVAPDGVILQANTTLENLLGTGPKALEGQSLMKFEAPGQQDKLYSQFKTLRMKRVSPPLVLKLKKGKDLDFWVRIDSSAAEPGPEGLVFRLVIGDITAERNAEESLRLLDRLNSLESLAGGIAHDFNNLLGGIFGYMNLARDLGQADPAVVRYLDKAGSVFQRATDLTSQLLTFTKRNLPNQKIKDLGPLVTKTTEFTLSGTGTQAHFSFEEGLWPVSVDEDQFRQVVDNLVRNASQAMGYGGDVRISLRNTSLGEGALRNLPPGYYCRLTVADSGPGISPEIVGRIFDPFFTTKEKGHGLGLATSHSIVKKHGGALWVGTEPGQGSQFHVLLPAAPGGICSEEDTPAGHHSGSGTVLIMDDEEFNREILGAILRGMGYEVLEARTGAEALGITGPEVPLKAAFLDLTIKGGRGGKDTVRPLVQGHPGLPVIAISGFSVDPIMTHPTDFGFTDSLKKPFLKSRVAELLEKYLG